MIGINQIEQVFIDALLLMNYNPCSAAGPHTIINGKEVVNFTSANYLGLIGHQKLLVRK